jgi:hypothetical protein
MHADRTTYMGLFAVGTAAAVLSFTALARLAVLAGVTGNLAGTRPGIHLAWLLPIAVDAYAATSTRIWLRAGIPAGTRAWARGNALAAIAVSMSGNAAEHWLTRDGTSLPVVLAVATVPPLMLAAVVHTAVLPMRPRDHAAKPRPATPVAPPETAGTDPAPALDTRPLTLVPDAARSAEGAAGGTLTARMRAVWDTERAAGRTPTGADLDRAVGAKGLGRKKAGKWLAEEPTAGAR